MDFQEFPKIGRFSRDIIISEKIDGTNAQLFIRELPDHEIMPTETPITAVVGKFLIYAGSRTRFITPSDDNFGFAAWVRTNAEMLAGLGVGTHYGEWWGSGIQRGYGLPKGEKRFSLFNVSRWALAGTAPQRIPMADPRVEKYQDVLPAGVSLVPVLYRGRFATHEIEDALIELARTGSRAAPGFMKPEGVVIFHTQANVGFKKTLEKDDEPKSRQPRELATTE